MPASLVNGVATPADLLCLHVQVDGVLTDAYSASFRILDESTLPAQQDAAIGMFGGADWAPDLNNPQSKKFVAGYEAAYNSAWHAVAPLLLLLPVLIWLAIRLLPLHIRNDCQIQAQSWLDSGAAKPRLVWGAVLIVSVWLLALLVLAYLLYRA